MQEPTPGPWCPPSPCAAFRKELSISIRAKRSLPDPCQIQHPIIPLILMNWLCQKPSPTRSASIANARCFSSLVGEGGQPLAMSRPTRFPAPTFRVHSGPAPRMPASPCSRPPGSPLLSGGRGWDAVHTRPSSTTLQREEMSARPAETPLPRRRLKGSQARQGHAPIPTHRMGSCSHGPEGHPSYLGPP